MGISKILYGTETLIDLTSDTVNAKNLRSGYTAHSSDGEKITGTLKTAALEPCIEELNCGWVGPGDGVWTPENPTQTYVDIYEVQSGHQYFLTLGANVGARFRAMFTVEDVSKATAKVTGIAVNKNTSGSGINNPSSYQNVTYTPETDGYIVVAKDNVGKTGIKTYLYDMTDGWE